MKELACRRYGLKSDIMIHAEHQQSTVRNLDRYLHQRSVKRNLPHGDCCEDTYLGSICLDPPPKGGKRSYKDKCSLCNGFLKAPEASQLSVVRF